MLFIAAVPLAAQQRNFVSALGGFAILSGDAKTDFSRDALASSYRPELGAALNLAAGRHFNDWVSVQGNYMWNRNTVSLAGVSNGSFYEIRNSSRQHAAVLDGLLYFRPLDSRTRPYLSAGIAAVNVSREAQEIVALRPPVTVPEQSAAKWYPGLRVAVGIDLFWKSGWGIRYSFSETIMPNLFSKSLVPPGSKNLMNFQNLWGVVKYF